MFCPKCGVIHNNEYPFCTECGNPMMATPAKKGRLWPPLLFIVIMLVIGINVFLAYPTETATETPTDDPWFQIKDGELTFDAALYNGSPELSVPNGVTALSDGCFYDCDKLHTVLLPEGLTSIGDRAFAHCDQLRGIKLPDGVTTIGEDAFEGCTALEALVIPATAETIGSSAFDDCDTLRHIFFEGTKQQWQALNVANFGTETTIYCTDGTI